MAARVTDHKAAGMTVGVTGGMTGEMTLRVTAGTATSHPPAPLPFLPRTGR